MPFAKRPGKGIPKPPKATAYKMVVVLPRDDVAEEMPRYMFEATQIDATCPSEVVEFIIKVLLSPSEYPCAIHICQSPGFANWLDSVAPRHDWSAYVPTEEDLYDVKFSRDYLATDLTAQQRQDAVFLLRKFVPLDDEKLCARFINYLQSVPERPIFFVKKNGLSKFFDFMFRDFSAV